MRRLVARRDVELQAMRKAGRVVAEMHQVIREAARPGVTTAQLDALARDVLDRRGARSNFLGYHGFPAVICASVNDEVIHGIPGPRVLADGDLLSIDCGAIVDGWHGDAAFTAAVGDVDPEALRLIAVCEASLAAAIEELREGRRIGDIGYAVESVVHAAGFSVVEGYTGHAIGQAMHEAPNVPNQGDPGTGPKLRVGNVLAIEPMVVAGGPETDVLDDDWSVVTADGAWAAHAEHTIAITPDGPEILTRLD